MPFVAPIVLLLIKFLAYTAWSWVALILLAPSQPASPRRAASLGLLRMGLGFGLGWLLVFSLTIVAPEQNRLGLSLPTFLFGFVVLRWLEWAFIGALASGSGKQFLAVLVRTSVREHLWRIGGLLVSFSTDLASLLGVGALGLIPC